MKSYILKSFIIIAILFLFYSCSNDDTNTTIIGKWKLIEVLADPGDGSGTFNPVNSNKTISFLTDSTFVTAGSLCTFTIKNDGESTGTFSSEKIFVNSCPNLARTVRNYKMQNIMLEVSYPCIEPCVEKYIKIESF